MAIAPDGSWLATTASGYDGTVRIWDPHTGQARHTLAGHTGGVSAVAIAPDGSWLVTTNFDGTVRIWRTDTARVAMSIRTGHSLRHVAVHGLTVAAAGDRGPYFLAVAAR